MTAPADKLKSRGELADECAAWRRRGETVALVNGAFDMLHVGHLRYLAAAREFGDRLVAAVNSDLSVRLSKGERRPIIPEIERVIGLRDGQVVMDDTPKRALTDQALSELFDTPLQVVEANGYRQVLPG